MLKNKVRLVAILLVVLFMVQCLASCTVTVATPPDKVPTLAPGLDRDPYKDLVLLERYYKIGDPTLIYTFSKEQEEQLYEAIDEANELLAEGTDVEEFLATYEWLDKLFTNVTSQYQLAYLEYCILALDEEAEANYLYISDLRTEVLQDLIVMYRTIYDSPFRDAFYEGWTEDEIEEALHQADLYTDEFVAMQQKSDEILVEYRAFDDPLKNKASVRDLYIEFAKNNHDIAVQMGYQNYMEYAYDVVYDRDYTYEQAADMAYYAEPLLALLDDVYTEFYRDLQECDNDTYYTFLNLALEYEITNSNSLQIVEDYITTLSPEAKDIYDGLWEDGNYFIISEENAYEGAFGWYLYEQEKPIVYFGPGYHNLTTFVHEFGHYMAYTTSPEGGDNFDLAEVQSQGNEMMFMRYLYSKYDAKAIDLLAKYNFLNAMATIVNSIAINEFETYVYTHIDTITADELDAKYREILDGLADYRTLSQLFGIAPSDYWYYVTIESPAYYISYGVSMIAALEIFAISEDNFEAGAEAYLALEHAETPLFSEELHKAGLTTPFEEETYDLLVDMILGYMPKE